MNKDKFFFEGESITEDEKANMILDKISAEKERHKRIEKLEKLEEEKLKRKQKGYLEQLEKFKNDTSYFKDYPESIDKENYILIRFFKHEPEKEFWGNMTLYSPNTLQKGSVLSEKVDLNYVVTNIAKVIKSGPGSKYNEGDLVLFPFEKVQGHSENQKWIDYKNSQMMAGATPIEPDDKRKVVPNVEVNYAAYKYKKPVNMEMDEDDHITYAVLDYEVVSSLK